MLKHNVGATLIALALVCGCNRGDSDSSERSDSTKAPVPATAAQAPPPYSEPQAVQIMLAIDQARLTNAEALRSKSENEAVLEYTRVVVTDHRAINALLDSLLQSTGETPAYHETSQQIVSAAQQFAMEIVQRDSGINNAYLAREIIDHERALQLLERGVIPSARSPQLKTMLEQLVPAYHAHLQQARDILAARRAAPPRAAAPSPAPTPAPAPVLLPRRDTTTIITTTTTTM